MVSPKGEWIHDDPAGIKSARNMLVDIPLDSVADDEQGAPRVHRLSFIPFNPRLRDAFSKFSSASDPHRQRPIARMDRWYYLQRKSANEQQKNDRFDKKDERWVC